MVWRRHRVIPTGSVGIFCNDVMEAFAMLCLEMMRHTKYAIVTNVILPRSSVASSKRKMQSTELQYLAECVCRYEVARILYKCLSAN